MAIACILAFMSPDAQANGDDTALDQRLDMIREFETTPGLLIPYRANYIMPVTYMPEPNQDPLNDLGVGSEEYDDIEVKFQISFMLPLWDDIWDDKLGLYFAYTQVAFWQLYNVELSQPFRDINYEPDLFLFFETDYELFGFKGSGVAAGFVHQSNGRGSQVLTRSWDRAYLNFLFSRGDFACSFKPWIRVTHDNQNPGIDDYMGHFELRASYRLNANEFSLMMRNNLDFNENYGAIELGWSIPLTKHVHGYVQYFSGYGESLLDYDYSSERIGIGILLNRTLGSASIK